MKTNKYSLGIVTTPIGKSGLIPLSNLIDILFNISDNIFIITGNEFTKQNIISDQLNVITLHYNYDLVGLDKVVNFLFLQLKITYNLLKRAKYFNYLFFFYGSTLLLPILASKILNKKVVLILTGSSSKASKSRGSVFSKPLYILERINLALSDHIIVYSQGLINKWNLEKYSKKITVAPRHFLDFNQLNIQKPLSERDNLVGYIGRLVEDKCVMNFVKSISIVLYEKEKTKFLIGGEGYLHNDIKEYLLRENLIDKVKYPGWIPHEEIHNYLNELKLLILPSVTEGLPNIMLEAMACGTPVLVTSVGAIPDIIIEGQTGFFLRNNDPNYIANRIVELLNKPELLEKVSINACRQVRNTFNFENAIKIYQKFVSRI